jgi:hypothetical protein
MLQLCMPTNALTTIAALCLLSAACQATKSVSINLGHGDAGVQKSITVGRRLSNFISFNKDVSVGHSGKGIQITKSIGAAPAPAPTPVPVTVEAKPEPKVWPRSQSLRQQPAADISPRSKHIARPHVQLDGIPRLLQTSRQSVPSLRDHGKSHPVLALTLCLLHLLAVTLRLLLCPRLRPRWRRRLRPRWRRRLRFTLPP